MVLDIIGLEVNVPTLIWTFINFFILLFLLRKFLFNPVLAMLDKRKAQIAEGMQKGADAAQLLEDTRAEQKKDLNKNQAEAMDILARAKAEGQKNRAQVMTQAGEDAAAISKDIEGRIKEEEERVRNQTEAQMPAYVEALAQRLIGEKE